MVLYNSVEVQGINISYREAGTLDVNSGHFALETHSDEIAKLIKEFFV